MPCEHGKQKNRCKECGGSSQKRAVCEHGRQKSRCKECGGSSFCEVWFCCMEVVFIGMEGQCRRAVVVPKMVAENALGVSTTHRTESESRKPKRPPPSKRPTLE